MATSAAVLRQLDDILALIQSVAEAAHALQESTHELAREMRETNDLLDKLLERGTR